MSDSMYSCHHCKTKKLSAYVISCLNMKSTTKKCRKKYCFTCLTKYKQQYPSFDPSVFKCPSCFNICQCSICRKEKRIFNINPNKKRKSLSARRENLNRASSRDQSFKPQSWYSSFSVEQFPENYKYPSISPSNKMSVLGWLLEEPPVYVAPSYNSPYEANSRFRNLSYEQKKKITSLLANNYLTYDKKIQKLQSFASKK